MLGRTRPGFSKSLKMFHSHLSPESDHLSNGAISINPRRKKKEKKRQEGHDHHQSQKKKASAQPTAQFIARLEDPEFVSQPKEKEVSSHRDPESLPLFPVFTFISRFVYSSPHENPGMDRNKFGQLGRIASKRSRVEKVVNRLSHASR